MENGINWSLMEYVLYQANQTNYKVSMAFEHDYIVRITVYDEKGAPKFEEVLDDHASTWYTTQQIERLNWYLKNNKNK